MAEEQVYKSNTPENLPGDSVIHLAWWVLFAGICALGTSFFVKTTTIAETYVTSGSPEVYNIGGLQNQIMWFHGGLAFIVIGVILHSAGLIVRHLAILQKSLEK